jgi:hypothetical protein
MIFLVAVVFIRSMIGWEITVSRGGSYIPKNRVRILALVCLPVLFFGSGEDLLRARALLYLASFGIIGIFISKSRPVASEE